MKSGNREAMEGYDLFSDDLPSLGSSMLEGLAELGSSGAGAEQYPSTNQGQGQYFFFLKDV